MLVSFVENGLYLPQMTVELMSNIYALKWKKTLLASPSDIPFWHSFKARSMTHAIKQCQEKRWVCKFSSRLQRNRPSFLFVPSLSQLLVGCSLCYFFMDTVQNKDGTMIAVAPGNRVSQRSARRGGKTKFASPRAVVQYVWFHLISLFSSAFS